jgi:hypothetical protein
MKLSIHRVAAVFVMGLLFGSYNHHVHMAWNRRGKDAFISHQLQRFDMHMAHPRTLIFTLASGIIGAAVIFAFYELTAIVLSRLFPSQPTAH